MSLDLRAILRDWEYAPDRLQARIIVGDDGLERIQVRIDLGIMQLELDGRPDGDRPHGRESLLDHFESLAAESGESRFRLDPEACASLMREGLQYYHRYLAAFHLERYPIVARDAERNLRLFAFVRAHAQRDRDKIEFDQYRPYVVMMRTRALVAVELARKDHRKALAFIDEGVKEIRGFLKEYGQENKEAECNEIQFLARLKRDVESERALGPLEQLERELERSIQLEHYEDAARIRDQIRRLGETDAASPAVS